MTGTEQLISELQRTLHAVLAYHQEPGDSLHSPRHAQARRATLDCTRALAAWRQHRRPFINGQAK